MTDAEKVRHAVESGEYAGDVDTLGPLLVGEIVRLREQLDRVDYALKEAASLENLGYNIRHAEDRPGQVDEAGVHLREYRRAASRLRRVIRRAREVIRS